MILKLFSKRLKAFYTNWVRNNEKAWGNSDVIVICTPPAGTTDHQFHPITSRFFFWLMGHDFPSTTAIFTERNIYFVSSKKKVNLLKTLRTPAKNALNVDVHVIFNGNDDACHNMIDKLLFFIRFQSMSDSVNRPLLIGCLSGESPKSKLLNTGQKNYQIVPVNVGFMRLLSPEGTNTVKKSKNANDIQMESLQEEIVQLLSLVPPVQENKNKTQKMSVGREEDANALKLSVEEEEEEEEDVNELNHNPSEENIIFTGPEKDELDEAEADDWVVVADKQITSPTQKVGFWKWHL